MHAVWSNQCYEEGLEVLPGCFLLPLEGRQSAFHVRSEGCWRVAVSAVAAVAVAVGVAAVVAVAAAAGTAAVGFL